MNSRSRPPSFSFRRSQTRLFTTGTVPYVPVLFVIKQNPLVQMSIWIPGSKIHSFGSGIGGWYPFDWWTSFFAIICAQNQEGFNRLFYYLWGKKCRKKRFFISALTSLKVGEQFGWFKPWCWLFCCFKTNSSFFAYSNFKGDPEHDPDPWWFEMSGLDSDTV